MNYIIKPYSDFVNVTKKLTKEGKYKKMKVN